MAVGKLRMRVKWREENVRVAETIVWFGVMVLGDDGHCTSTPIIIPQLEASSKIANNTKANKQVTKCNNLFHVILVR